MIEWLTYHKLDYNPDIPETLNRDSTVVEVNIAHRIVIYPEVTAQQRIDQNRAYNINLERESRLRGETHGILLPEDFDVEY